MSNTDGNILDKVGIFFARIPCKKILAFLFFLTLSAMLWVLQVYRQKFETTLVIPVKYTNIPDSIVFEQNLPPSVKVMIKDDGEALFRYYFQKRNDSIVVNMRNLIYTSPERAVQGRNIEQLIREHLFITSELISYSPSRISFAYDILHQKRLPVIYNGYARLSPGYMIDGDLVVAPDSVNAFGSKAALDTLLHAYTQKDTIQNLDFTFDAAISLLKVHGVRFVPNKVNLFIPVDEFMVKQVDVPVVCVNLPENMNIKFFPSVVKIPFSVGLKRFGEINEENFQATIDYNDILQLPERTSPMPVRITESPDFVKTKLPIPSEVEFVLELK